MQSLSKKEEAMESNNLCCQEIERQIEVEEEKKDRTKKLHPTIVNMLKRAAATDWNDEDKKNAPTCLRFINSDDVGLDQYECWGRCRHCSGNYEARGASVGKYKARIVIFCILATVDRFSWISWKVESC
jgi:hypothetical protein